MGVVQLVMRRASAAPSLLTGLFVSIGIVAAGCGTAAHGPARKTQPASQERAVGQSASPSARASCHSGAPARAAAGAGPTSALNAVQFVSASNGWVIGSDRILHTADGGQHWTAELRTSPSARLGAVDFTDARHGWVVGAKELLTTTDGGTHWRSLPEPCPAVRTVHFVNSQDGFAVASGAMVNPAQPPYVAGPPSGGVLLHTTDGGVHWQRLPAPANVQTVCFSDLGRGWLGAGGNIYGTANSGQRWTLAVRGP